jgi:hypothetical protein
MVGCITCVFVQCTASPVGAVLLCVFVQKLQQWCWASSESNNVPGTVCCTGAVGVDEPVSVRVSGLYLAS